MVGWFARLAMVVLALLTAVVAGGTVLGAASAETRVTELLVTCLSCGERWVFVPSASMGAGLLTLFRLRKLVDRCPKCGCQTVTFTHTDDPDARH
jgi:Zn finger protein HypA/HybF involved in hydrogenase expression